MADLPKTRKNIAYYLAEPSVRLLVKTPLTPNILTWFGFCLAILTAAIIALGHPFAAGFVVLVSGYFDILDGALARRTQKTSRFGAILDSTLDRLSEALVLLGILTLFLFNKDPSLFGLIDREWSIFACGVTLLISPIVSYIRARGEALGVDCQVGAFTRAERVVVLALGLLTKQIAIALAIIAALSLVTVSQRLFCVYRQTKQ